MHLPDAPGLWADCPTGRSWPGRPALFLDRDGVLVEEVHFLRRTADVRLSCGIAQAIAAANAADVPVVLVTNQSGIARGHFGWPEFLAVQSEIEGRLAAMGARLDAVFACGCLEGGLAPFDQDPFGWRKPMPGMLLAARDRLAVDLSRSEIVGDRLSDLDAGRKAGLLGGTLVLTGYGTQNVLALERSREAWTRDHYIVDVVAEPAAAVRSALSRLVG